MSWDGRLLADARYLPIASESVQCVVTSPPYWGLRSYDVDSTAVIGSEPTLDGYLYNLGWVFHEVWRVLKPNGTLWLNLGDAYANDGKWGGATGGKQEYLPDADRERVGREKRSTGLKPKDLIGVPWRVAFALQAAGWYLRSDIIWAKQNCMPESVQDRPTRSHEYLFLLAKSERYFYNAKAIAEPSITGDLRKPYAPGQVDGRGNGHDRGGGSLRWKPRKTAALDPNDGKRRAVEHIQQARDNGAPHDQPFGDTRNKRDVWWLATVSYPEAHYATFPPDLVTPCILAGSSPGDFILDPFAGSGTVAMVAERLHRRWISCDLGYQDLQSQRLSNLQYDLFS